jgi:hypothetical protein
MISSKYIIFDRDGNYYEYNAKDVFEAIDKYILFYIRGFHITFDTWNKIKTSCTELEERISLVNQLCDCNDSRIDRIIANYDYLFGYEISPVETEELN